jgi:hypothetical protein
LWTRWAVCARWAINTIQIYIVYFWCAAIVGSFDIRYSGDGYDACVIVVGENRPFKPIIEIG